jgi:hypothetical protein
MKAADLQVTDGASSGAWVKPGLGGDFGAVTLQVPEVFEAYARVFHPADDLDGNPVTWGEVAKFCGTTPHPEMQWHAIAGLPRYQNLEDSKWPGQEPNIGEMDISTLDALCEVLAPHTEDPAHCLFGLCVIERWEDAFSKAELRGHRLLKLPMGRHHIVLEGALSAVDQIVDERSGGVSFTFFAEKGSERPSEEEIAELLKPSRSSPNLIWPADRSWLVVSEVDFDSTLVGGSTELIEAIVASPALEAWQVEPTTSLAEGADKINMS